jgi:hypothetical protein
MERRDFILHALRQLLIVRRLGRCTRRSGVSDRFASAVYHDEDNGQAEEEKDKQPYRGAKLIQKTARIHF